MGLKGKWGIVMSKIEKSFEEMQAEHSYLALKVRQLEAYAQNLQKINGELVQATKSRRPNDIMKDMEEANNSLEYFSKRVGELVSQNAHLKKQLNAAQARIEELLVHTKLIRN